MTNRAPKAHVPLALPAVSADEFEEIESITDKKGRVLRRFRHRLTGAVGVEVPFELVECGEVTPEPMTLPSSSIFYLDYHYEGIEAGIRRVPPLRRNLDYVSTARPTFIVDDSDAKDDS